MARTFGAPLRVLSGQCLPEKFVDICVLGKFSHDAADHVDYVGVELYLLEIFHVHPAAAAAEVVAGKVYEHDMLGVLFGVIEKFLREFMVAGVVACATECPGYRVDVCLPVCSHAEMSLRRRAEYLEIAEIEEKQIGGGIDGAECAIDVELIPVNPCEKRREGTI